MQLSLFEGSSGIDELLKGLNIGAGEGASSSVFNVASVIIAIALILFCGFLMTRLTKLLRLPNVTAYIICGIIIGPCALNLIPTKIIQGTEFLSDIALAFIAFAAGEFFKLDVIKKCGKKLIIITLFESLMTFLLVFIITKFACGISTSFSFLLAALGSATAPASTLMTIRQTKARGDYVNTLLGVVALDDVVTLVLFTIGISICLVLGNNGSSSVSFETVGWPLIKALICLALGFGFGFLLRLLTPKRRTTDNRLIIVIAVLFLFCGVCLCFNTSPLLGCMAIGAVYTNTAKEDGEKLFKQVNYFAPPLLLIFFVRSGMSFDLGAFTSTSAIGVIPLAAVAVIYFVTRIAGKYSGSFFGGLVTKSDKKIRNYLGLGLIPQAGVAIGLAAMAARTFNDAGQAELGTAINTIILASSVLYELIGPACSKLGLYLSKSYSNKIDDIVPVEQVTPEDKQTNKPSEVDLLIAQINKIQEEIPATPPPDPNEAAFDEAAEEYSEVTGRNYNRFINRR